MSRSGSLPKGEATSRAEDIFYAALQIERGAGREAYLQEACGADCALRAAVDDLLSSHERAEGLFRESSAALKPPTELVRVSPERVAAGVAAGLDLRAGDYELVQRLGEGGSGVVFLARQTAPVRREVALKILKLGMDTQQVIARFEAERQTLAIMEHPNIARVLDAGATKNGRPYFVMELVRGVSLTDFCALNRVPLVERLRLFQQVCHAVQHAHQKGVIHRDLKPSNILVAVHDGAAVPKVIDFGIAKAVGGAPSGANLTLCDQLIGTPAYMSPEQARGGWSDVDTRSDVYSLGVVLYELLAGRPPFRNEELIGAGLEEMRRRLQTEEPLRPSAQAQVEAKGEARTVRDLATSGRRWADALCGDLDWIVMKALEKDRDCRYETVRGLSQDIERHLANEPVLARPPSRLYKLNKMVRRNRPAFAAAGSAALALIAGFTTSTRLYLKASAAERQQSHLRTVAERALRQEAALRKLAENRERIAHAAILLLHRRCDEADTLVRQIPGPLTEPSVEAANVFRGLAEWCVMRGDAAAAAQRALRLLEVDQFDASDRTDVVTRDLVVVAPTLIEAGELSLYEDLRMRAIGRFAGTASPVAAEQVMKTCLLLPPGPEILPAVERLARIEQERVGDRNASIVDRAWGSAVLGLLEYRRGSYAESVSWCARSGALSYRNKAHQALCLAVQGMSRWKLHEESAARDDLTQARRLVDDWFAHPTRGAEAGVWNDWLIARILLREAGELIEQAGVLEPGI